MFKWHGTSHLCNWTTGCMATPVHVVHAWLLARPTKWVGEWSMGSPLKLRWIKYNPESCPLPISCLPNLPSFCHSLPMPPVLSEKSRKHATVTPYSRKPGPKGPHTRNQPASASTQVKQPSQQLTNHDWLTVFAWMDANPNRPQQSIVDHFANRREGPLRFNQGTLSRKLKKRGDIEALVKANPAALSARRQRVVVSPEVERALVLWVEDMQANNLVINGPLLTAKRKTLEEKLNIPPDKHLSDKGWLQGFCKV